MNHTFPHGAVFTPWPPRWIGLLRSLYTVLASGSSLPGPMDGGGVPGALFTPFCRESSTRRLPSSCPSKRCPGHRPTGPGTRPSPTTVTTSCPWTSCRSNRRRRRDAVPVPEPPSNSLSPGPRPRAQPARRRRPQPCRGAGRGGAGAQPPLPCLPCEERGADRRASARKPSSRSPEMLQVLDGRWRVLHAVPVGDRGNELDHLVVGPGRRVHHQHQAPPGCQGVGRRRHVQGQRPQPALRPHQPPGGGAGGEAVVGAGRVRRRRPGHHCRRRARPTG